MYKYCVNQKRQTQLHDRLTRSSKDFHKLVEQLGANNVVIKCDTETIDTTTAVGRFQLELSISLAQLESISECVSFVMEERNTKGLRNGSPVRWNRVKEEFKS